MDSGSMNNYRYNHEPVYSESEWYSLEGKLNYLLNAVYGVQPTDTKKYQYVLSMLDEMIERERIVEE